MTSIYADAYNNTAGARSVLGSEQRPGMLRLRAKLSLAVGRSREVVVDDAQERDWADRRENGWSSEDVFASMRAKAETWLGAWGRLRQPLEAAGRQAEGRVASNITGLDAAEEASRAQLARMIEAEVVPRLMLAHRGAAGDAETLVGFTTAAVPKGEEQEGGLARAVEALAHEALSAEAPALAAIVRERRAEGLSAEGALLRLIAPAARRIGEFWESDERDFVDVTIALTRLHAVAREVAREGLEDGQRAGAGDAPALAVVAAAPGEQHVLGALMVAELLRRRGAAVIEAYPETVADLREAVEGRDAGLICLSITRTPPDAEAVAALRRAVDAARAVSLDHAVVVVGGRAIEANPDLAAQIGAVACDAQSLGGFVEHWLGATVGRC